jgi:hypothetical protein
VALPPLLPVALPALLQQQVLPLQARLAVMCRSVLRLVVDLILSQATAT